MIIKLEQESDDDDKDTDEGVVESVEHKENGEEVKECDT